MFSTIERGAALSKSRSSEGSWFPCKPDFHFLYLFLFRVPGSQEPVPLSISLHAISDLICPLAQLWVFVNGPTPVFESTATTVAGHRVYHASIPSPLGQLAFCQRSECFQAEKTEAQLVLCLHSMCGDLGSIPSISYKQSILGYSYNPNTRDVEAGESEIQGHSQLYHEFKANLGYVRTFSKRKGNLPRPATNISAFPHSSMVFQIDHSLSLLDFEKHYMVPLNILGK